jgi:hypothetical protein
MPLSFAQSHAIRFHLARLSTDSGSISAWPVMEVVQTST